MLRKLFITLLLTILSCTLTHAQSYPVQVSVQLVPPFSGYLPDYAAPGNDNLRIYLTLTDFSLPSYDVKLKFALTGNNVSIQSKPWYYSGPITLEPGVPLLLTGTDLSGMLNSANLDYTGISLPQYNQTKVLPEGFYTFTITAYDFANPLPIPVSNEGTAQAWMLLCDPPLTNLPACGSEVPSSDPQFLTFSWSPLNMSAPTSALGTEYLFELWEVMPPNNAPGNVVSSTAPMYSVTTNLTMITYGLAEPPLQIGWTYVWRVRAYDLDNRALFRNNGYSQVCTFTYGDQNELLGNLAQLTLSATVLTHRQARCNWDSTSVYASYHLEFRKVNTANWFPVNTTNSSARITALEPLTQYEAQVQGIFPNGGEGPWSNIVTFTTPAQAVLNCGDASPPPAQQNFSPLTQATTGMIWQVGQFEMIVTQLNNMSNPNGLYSGLGKVIMPLGVTVNCSYTNIQMGVDQVMYAGEVKAVTEGVSAWMNQYNASGFVNPEITYNGEINNASEIIVNELSGTITIGSETYQYETAEGTAIEDANGTLWVITSSGDVVLAGQTGVVFVPPPPTELNTTNGKVTFQQNAQQLYGYDHASISAWTNYYSTVHDINGDVTVKVDWKSVQSTKYDVISVHYSNLNGILPDSIFFYCPSGTIYHAQGSGMDRRIYIVGGDNNDRQDIYAAYRNSAGEIVNIGKICVTSYEEQTNTIWLVPFGNATNPAPSINQQQVAALKTKLDSIYSSAVVRWNVQLASTSLQAEGWDNNNDHKIDVSGQGLSPYSEEMNSLVSALHYESWYNNNDNYLIISSVPPDSTLPGLQGTMPRNKNCGFIFTSPSSSQFTPTVAHEIGHGVYGLKHSFEGTSPAPKNTTDNLMDYSYGVRLVGWQWNWMRNPAGWGILDDDQDDDRVFVDMRELLPFLNPDSLTFTFFSPAGKPISLPRNGLESVVFSYGDDYKACPDGGVKNAPIGSLSGFKLNGVKYLATADCASNNFFYYKNNTSNQTYIDSISPRINPAHGIVGYPCVAGGAIVFVVSQANINTNTEYGENYTASGVFRPHILVWDYFSQNIATTQIAANISPPYSSDATAYLCNNLDNAGCGEVGVSFVLTYAYQINRYPETYECCIKNQELASANPQLNSINLPPPTAYESVNPASPMEAKEQQLNQLAIDTRVNFRLLDQKRKAINAELMGITTHSVMADSLNSIPAYTCIWNELSAKTRLHCISVLSQSTVQGDWLGMGNNYERLVNDLLITTNDPLQQDSLLNAISANEFALFKSLWNVLDFDGLDEFVNTITGWLISRDTSRPTYASLVTGVFQNNANTPNRYFEFYSWATLENASTFTFTATTTWIGSNIQLITNYDPVKSDGFPGGTATVVLDGYDWVAIQIMEDIPSLGLKQNQRLVVPMIWARWLARRIQTNDTSHKLELIGEIVQFLAMDYFATALLESIAFEAVNSSAAITQRFVGQDLAVVASTSTKSSVITLDMEVGVDNVATWNGVKWEAQYNPASPVVGRVNGVKFLSQEGQVVQRELTLVEVGETICVRDATAVATSGTFVEGESISGKVILQVKNGSNGKIAVIGRKMAGHVEVVGAELRASGLDVELFNAECQRNNLFNIKGHDYTWEEIETDFRNLNGQYQVDNNGWITNEELPNTLMYQANEVWANKILNQGYTIIDMGVPPGVTTPSVFYNMEQSTIFGQ